MRLWERERETEWEIPLGSNCVAVAQLLWLGFRRAVHRRRYVRPWMVNVKLKPSLCLRHSASLSPWLRAVPSSWLCGSSLCCGRWVTGWCLSNGEAVDLAANRWSWFGIFFFRTFGNCCLCISILLVMCCLFVFFFFLGLVLVCWVYWIMNLYFLFFLPL